MKNQSNQVRDDAPREASEPRNADEQVVAPAKKQYRQPKIEPLGNVANLTRRS